MTGSSFARRRPTRRLGLVAVFVAVLCQLLLGPAALADELASGQVTLDNGFVICRSHGAADDGSRAPTPHHAACCVLCPLHVSHMQATFIPTPVPTLPTPSPGLVVRPGLLPQARAPPPPPIIAAFPRGPPALLA